MEKELISSAQVQEFLADFENNATVELLEDAKEKNEIFEIALARGINLKESKDIAGFKCVYCFADIANKNKARLPKKALLKSLPTLVGKPVDVDHLRNAVIGVLIDSRYIVKDESVIAYGILFKSNFPDEWSTIEKKFKEGKVSVSYEIYCPQNKRTQNADGTYSLEEQIIAGMAILFKESPAFPNAKVLELAKEIKTPEELVFASYKCSDIIINGETKCKNCGKCKHVEVARYITEDELKNFKLPDNMELIKTDKGTLVQPKVETPKVEEKKPKVKCQGCNTELDYLSIPEKGMGYIECPTCKKNIDQTGKILISNTVAPIVPAPIVIQKIKCANCQKVFDAPKCATSEIKCSECFAIINDKGDILYPPQIIDFNISCPSCSSRNWRLLKKDEATGEIKCLSCAKKYAIEFSKVEANALLNMIQFLHVGHISCKQCGYYVGYSGTSQVKDYNLKCKKCGLTFAHDITNEQIKTLSKITEITEPINASVSMDDLNEMPAISSKADELNKDISAIKEEAKGEVKMEQKPVENIVEVSSTPDAKSEVAEVKVATAETVIPVVAKEEEKIVEVAKVEEVVAPVVEVAKVEEVVVPVVEVAPIVEAKIEVAPIIEVKVETPVEAKIEDLIVKLEIPIEVSKDIEVVIPVVAKEETKEEKKTKKHKEWLRKLDKKMKEMKKEKASIVKTLEEKIEFYKANAEEINKRRKELGETGKNLSDEELIDNAKFSDAKLIQANLETSSIAGTKKTDEDNLNKYRKEITDKAEGRIKRTK